MANHRPCPDLTECKTTYFAKELYYSVFLLFFKLGEGRWPAHFRADEHKGVAGVSAVEFLLLLSAFAWSQIALGRQLQLSHWMLWLIATLAYATNYRLLISSGNINACEKRFAHLDKGKRLALRASSIAVVLGSVLIFVLSVIKFKSTFHIRI